MNADASLIRILAVRRPFDVPGGAGRNPGQPAGHEPGSGSFEWTEAIEQFHAHRPDKCTALPALPKFSFRIFLLASALRRSRARLVNRNPILFEVSNRPPNSTLAGPDCPL
jgi:hypothetical protein